MKNYTVHASLAVLERTPKTLHALLNGLPDEWVTQDEGPGTWSAFDVVSHLLFCEQMNFYTRIQLIRSGAAPKVFPFFDMGTQFELTKGKKLIALLTAFADLRAQHLDALQVHPISEAELDMTGIHPKIGIVTLRNVLATWVAHDLAHTAQVARVMAKQCRQEVGPFIDYLRILT